MNLNSISKFNYAAIYLAAVALPTSAMAETCAELQTRRDTAITFVNTQNNALRECLIAFPNWREEAHDRYYDAYDVTETIPGKPRRVVISHGRYSSTAYVAAATRTRVERSVEYEDIGVEKRLSLFSQEDRIKIYALGKHMSVVLGDEFLLCRDKADAVGFVEALAKLGWGWQGGLIGVQMGEGWDAPFGKQTIEKCLNDERNSRILGQDPESMTFRAEFNALSENDRRAVATSAFRRGQTTLNFLLKQRRAGVPLETIVAAVKADQPQTKPEVLTRPKPRIRIRF